MAQPQITAAYACLVLGINCTRVPTQHMVRALSMHSWLNSADQEERRRVGKWALKHWDEYQRECNRVRDELYSSRRRAS